MRWGDEGVSMPWLRSPRLKRGDALLTMLALTVVVGVLLVVIATVTKVAPPEGAILLWGAMFGGCLVSYSGKRIKIKAGPIEIQGNEDGGDG